MMMDNSTSCRNVCATHEMMAGRPALSASGKLISASAAKAYAHHIEPTPSVIHTASFELNRLTGDPVGMWPATLVGACLLRCSLRGWSTGAKVVDVRQES